MRPFLVCIHDATPAYARETRVMIRDLAPLLGRRLCFAVVPDWHGGWPLPAHPDHCRMVREVGGEPVWRRSLGFHLTQAELSLECFRDIARLLAARFGE